MPAKELDVQVFRNGRLLRTITRPLHAVDGRHEVTYKWKRYAVLPGSRIDVDEPTPDSPHWPIKPAPSVSVGPTNPSGRTRSDAPSADDWTLEQGAVIRAPIESRVIVEAPPGTGKTAVACARVAHLLKENVPAANIWLVSFTRTAIQEVRNRIAVLCKEVDAAYGVRIATIDSHAWQLRQGFDGAKAKTFASFEQGISDAIAMLASPSDDLIAELETIQHIVIDEAQDVVGSRCEMLYRLIGLLRKHAGVTVLEDPAQAIYDFTEDDDSPLLGSESLSELLLAEKGLGFETCQLKEIIRTATPGLRHIFLNTRQLVLHEDASSMKRLLDDLKANASGSVDMALANNGIDGRDDVLVLYRTRSEVLTSASYVASAGAPFRVRMSGYPNRIASWIGVLLWDWTKPVLHEEEFLRRVDTRPVLKGASSQAEARWRALVRHAGKSSTVIDVRRLREVLSREQPPLDFASPELGEAGPILGTIHASKGREAEEVHLMLADLDGNEVVDAEEKRVVFVGATRARSVLKIGRAGGKNSSKTPSGRRFHGIRGKAAAQIEIGRRGDLSEAEQVSRRLFATPVEALDIQGRVQSLDGTPLKGRLQRLHVGDSAWCWRLFADDVELPFGQLEEQFNDDLLYVRKKVSERRGGARIRPTMRINNVFILGSRTVVRPEGDHVLPLLHEPWAASGIWLMPSIFAYPTVHYY